MFLKKSESWLTRRYPFLIGMALHLPIPYGRCYKFQDGSDLLEVPASWLVKVPPWEGNRTLQYDHVERLKQSIQDPKELEGPYVIAIFPPKQEGESIRWGIVDGQHRAEVLRQLLPHKGKDFQVLVRVYDCASDLQVIDLFRKINTQKPVNYELSPEEKQHEVVKRLVAEFQRQDTGHKLTEMIRSGARQRPFLATEVLLQALRQRRFFTTESPGTCYATPQEIVDRIVAWNAEKASSPHAYLATLRGLTPSLVARAATYGFYLGLDPYLGWLAQCAVPVSESS